MVAARMAVAMAVSMIMTGVIMVVRVVVVIVRVVSHRGLCLTSRQGDQRDNK
jgi:hypothetical protein